MLENYFFDEIFTENKIRIRKKFQKIVLFNFAIRLKFQLKTYKKNFLEKHIFEFVLFTKCCYLSVEFQKIEITVFYTKISGKNTTKNLHFFLINISGNRHFLIDLIL